MIGSFVTRHAMRPLVAVTEALEHFAQGEHLPAPVEASTYDERLASAYNAASAHMREVLTQREIAYQAMQQCIADAGHQLRTPITVLRGFIGVFRQGTLRDEADRERIVNTMHRQCVIMSTLVDKLLLLERLEHEEIASAPIDVGQLVEDVVMPFAEQNPERTLSLMADSDALAAISPSDLVHVVSNLVDNALKYTAGAVEVHVAKCSEEIVVQVSDQGPSMTEDELAHAFDRFYRGASRRSVDGSGLGLPIVKRIVELKGGSVVAEAANGGSRITVRLPRYA
jgi:two-component system OmpR family sensor kinase